MSFVTPEFFYYLYYKINTFTSLGKDLLNYIKEQQTLEREKSEKGCKAKNIEPDTKEVKGQRRHKLELAKKIEDWNVMIRSVV